MDKIEGQDFFRKCGSCKKEINFGSKYFVCEVTSCKKHAYCSVDCWNVHNEIMNHKNAGAMEERAPKSAQGNVPPRETRRIVSAQTTSTETSPATSSMEEEILIVASKLKQYEKDKYDLNTSANVMEVLSNIVRREADRACRNAVLDNRKTLMDRDF